PAVARYFAATHGEADQREILQLELRHQLVQVGGEGVVVVARSGLAGLAEPSAVIGDHTVARGQKRRDLFLPGSTTQRISVDKDYGVSGAVVFVVQFDVTGIFFADFNVW